MAMNPEVKAEWVKALRSGEYKQTKHVLHRVGGGYCCLGVLCELAVKAGAIPAAKRNDADPAWYYDGAGSCPSDKVDEWAGCANYAEADVLSDLMELNDNGTSFKAIADVIEARL